MRNNIPEPVKLAQKVLKDFKYSASYNHLKKSLPALAMQIGKSNTELTENILKSHANLGVKHVKSLKQHFSNSSIKQKLNYKDTVRTLIKDVPIETNEQDYNSNLSSLDLSIKKGDIKEVENLIDNGANYNYAIIWASLNGKKKIVQLLIDKGADIRDGNNYAIKCAARNDQIAIVQLLIDNGADIKAINLNDRGKKRLNIKLQNLRNWKKIYKSSPPDGLDGLNPYGFKPDLFKKVKSWLENECYNNKKTAKYAYEISTLLGNENRILQYLKKWGQESKQPLSDLICMIDTPLTGKIDNKSWGDGILKFGPEMAKLIKFADKLKKPEKSLNKTRKICTRLQSKRGLLPYKP